MKDFDSFYTTLISEQAWFEAIQMTYRNKDYKQVAMECYTWLLTQPQLWQSQDYTRYRQSYQKFLLYSKDKEQIIVPPKAVPVSIHPDALTGEAREKRIQEYLDALAKVPALKKIAPNTRALIENGDWRPKPDDIREPTEEEKMKTLIAYLQKMRTARTKMFREKYPHGTVKELRAYLNKWKHFDNPLNIKF